MSPKADGVVHGAPLREEGGRPAHLLPASVSADLTTALGRSGGGTGVPERAPQNERF